MPYIKSSMTILSLPPELVLEIAAYLPTSALISLKLANKYIGSVVSSPPNHRFRDLSPCEKNSIRRYINERANLRTGRRRCLLCNTLQELRFFRDDSPVCTGEEGRFMTISSSSSSPPPPPPGSELESYMRKQIEDLTVAGKAKRDDVFWFAVPQRLCLHTGVITGRARQTTLCECHCDSCAHVEVSCYVRVAGELAPMPRSWDLVVDDEGQWTMSEVYGQIRRSGYVSAQMRRVSSDLMVMAYRQRKTMGPVKRRIIYVVDY